MIGEELVAAVDRGAGHLLDGVVPIRRPRRVRVEVTLELALLDEPGQRSGASGLELARVLAKLGRDELVAEVGVERLLVAVRDDLARLDDGDAVLRDREAAPLRLLSHRDVVILRAGEVLKEVAEALRRDDAKVDPNAKVRDHGRLRPSLRDDFEHPRQAHEMLDQALRASSRSR